MSCDTGQRIPCFDSCQLSTTWMCEITLQAPTLARQCDESHWFSCDAEWTYGHVTTKFLGWKGNQIFLAMGPHARGAPLLSFYTVPGAAIRLHTFL